MYYQRSRPSLYPETFLTWGNGLHLSLPGQAYAFLAAPLRALDRHRRRNRTLSILRSLDDRTLKDIGIHRSEIPSIVEGLGSFAGRRDRT